MTRQAFDILVIEPSDFYRKAIEKILSYDNHRVTFCETLSQGRKYLDEKNFNLVIIDTDIPDGDPFDFQKNEIKNYSNVALIITTELNVDKFVEVAVDSGAGSILCKPIKREELLILIQKLITKKNIFGLYNYLHSPSIIYDFTIRNSTEIDKSVKKIMDYAISNGFNFPNEVMVKLSIQEVLVNAIYHGYGYTAEKMQRIPITLSEDQEVVVSYGHDLTKFGVAISDSAGKLSKKVVLKTLRDLVVRERIIKEKIEKGEDISEFLVDGGRGIDLFRKISGEYLINIKPQKKTEIVLIYDMDFEKDDLMSSIKILEL